jgi:hypothetical protein
MRRLPAMKRRVWCFWALLPVFWTCGDGPTGTTDDIEQQYLFEVEHINMAWIPRWVGSVIERDGSVYAYDRSEVGWPRTSSTLFAEDELRDKYSVARRLIGHVDADVLVRQFERIRGVGDDFDETIRLCADAGVLTYRAWRYHSAEGLYEPLTLREEGDVGRRNTSDAAEALAEWLRELIPTLDGALAMPFNEGLCTP